MKKSKIIQRIALLASLIMLITSTVNVTYGFIVTHTDSLINIFIPPEIPDDNFVTITVNKTVKNTGESSIGPEGFEFVLENTDTDEKTTKKSDSNGKAIFYLTYTAEDVGKTYTYTLSETDSGQEGVTYDTKVYDISVAISLSDDNELTATVTMKDNNDNVVENRVAEFENIYYTDKHVSPPTDDNSITFWFVMMAISATSYIVLLLINKKCRKATQN